MSVAKSNASRPSSPLAGENQLLWTLWLTYGAFYFCRTNISAALPGLEAGLELSKTQIGFIL
ncbi:MAG: hypothetical protein VCA36_13285, partial [Opitutales bacterium]